MELTLIDKVNLIKEAESTKMTRQQLGEKFGIGKTTVTDIIKKKDQYLKQFEENADGSRQRVKTTTKFEDVCALVWTWFQQARAKTIPVSGPMVQEKALAIATDISECELQQWRASVQLQETSLVFEAVQEEDSGNYTCELQLQRFLVRRTTHLSVTGNPTERCCSIHGHGH
ncbi:hypothetical protein ACEWY4_027710 [Coilia grayii]|uniref:Ig-like domain-containing protein n=1 Tax=Coilia grayii TaxID=363190 RepID=A0ABD1INX6_9TELE